MIEVIRAKGLSMQVCAPKDATDEEIVAAAERQNPCGTERGWQVCKAGSWYLDGAEPRVQCASRPDHVHVILGA